MMNKKMSVVATMLCLLLVLPTQGLETGTSFRLPGKLGYMDKEPECGWQAGGHSQCPPDYCCSAEGYCGRDKHSCTEGCQNNCDYYLRCGWEYNGRVCQDNLCCSEKGWCGSEADQCGNGCQSGPCWYSSLVLPTESSI